MLKRKVSNLQHADDIAIFTNSSSLRVDLNFNLEKITLTYINQDLGRTRLRLSLLKRE